MATQRKGSSPTVKRPEKSSAGNRRYPNRQKGKQSSQTSVKKEPFRMVRGRISYPGVHPKRSREKVPNLRALQKRDCGFQNPNARKKCGDSPMGVPMGKRIGQGNVGKRTKAHSQQNSNKDDMQVNRQSC